ncbi:MAG: hypothetical protein QOE70_3664 [Chthoniobacter sp.]|jgi:hypothetical protein|nr:hypothetical protein [Chthoniobacter sp.]
MMRTLERAYRAALRLPVLKPLAPKLNFAVRYRNEWLLLKGLHGSRSERPSMAFFTMHKAASVYVANVLKRLAREAGLTLIDFDGYLFMGGKTPGDVHQPGELARRMYQPHGYFYGPFRAFNPGIPDLDKYRVVLNVRDPRDVLVSAYFSVAYSHYVPDQANPEAAKKIRAARESTLQADIDEWVLASAPSVLEICADYRRNLLHKPHVLLAKYEKLVTDFDGWLAEITAFMEVKPAQRTLDELRGAAEFKVEESAARHKRQVTPGDHQRKLKPETVARLNELFAEDLRAFGWPVEG